MTPEAIQIAPFDFTRAASFYTCEVDGCGVRVAVNFGHPLHARLTTERKCPIHMPVRKREEVRP